MDLASQKLREQRARVDTGLPALEQLYSCPAMLNDIMLVCRLPVCPAHITRTPHRKV
jgi:hypothetical protein